MTQSDTGSGKNRLFLDSKYGVIVTGLFAVGFDAVLTAVLNTLTSVDTSGWSGWWTTAASGALAIVIGLVTAYKARRDKAHAQRF